MRRLLVLVGGCRLRMRKGGGSFIFHTFFIFINVYLGHYGTHPDFYPYDEHRLVHPDDNGNRISTVMTVLEAPEAGT